MTALRVAALPSNRCIVCQSPVGVAVTDWTTRCPSCGTWNSNLAPAINQATRYTINDEARIAGLERLRRQNFAELLDRIEQRRSLTGTALLDVGSAYGWFLEEAQARGARVLGVEPDERIACHAAGRDLNVRAGWFPEALQPAERFDIITFNDVLEHLPDVRGALAACIAHLAHGGLLSVSIPTSDGVGYRVATLLARLGIAGPFERFWQAGLPSPHTYYFPRASLTRLLRDCGFTVLSVDPLTAVVAKGLWARVHTFRRPSPASIASYAALLAARPILNQPRASDVVQVIATLV
jgi:SAM-dependent methyltransferase